MFIAKINPTYMTQYYRTQMTLITRIFADFNINLRQSAKSALIRVLLFHFQFGQNWNIFSEKRSIFNLQSTIFNLKELNMAIKIGFIGCGGNANGHMNNITNNIENGVIVATCDLKEELANSAAQRNNAKAYTEHQKMLDEQNLDAVYISIPVFAHGQPELDVIERGLPFFVEKPVGIDMETAKTVEKAVKESGIITCVGYQLRYCGSAGLAKEMLKEENIGMVVAKYWSGTGRGDPNRWLRQMKRSGGQLLEQATHTIDMMRFLAGDIKEVYAMQANRNIPEIDCPDVNSVSFRFENGAVGSLTATWAYDPKDWSHANLVDILYDMALMQWSPGKLVVTKDGETNELNRPTRSIDQVFIDAVEKGDGSEILSPYSDAVKSMAVSIAANLSGAEGTPKKIT